jgi:hypothetical protein
MQTKQRPLFIIREIVTAPHAAERRPSNVEELARDI